MAGHNQEPPQQTAPNYLPRQGRHTPGIVSGYKGAYARKSDPRWTELIGPKKPQDEHGRIVGAVEKKDGATAPNVAPAKAATPTPNNTVGFPNDDGSENRYIVKREPDYDDKQKMKSAYTYIPLSKTPKEFAHAGATPAVLRAEHSSAAQEPATPGKNPLDKMTVAAPSYVNTGAAIGNNI